MALGMKGFRARRRSGKAGETESPETQVYEEKIPLSQHILQWISENPRTIRNSLYAVMAVTVIVILVFVLHAAARDEHSRKLHAALEKYDQIKILPKGEARALQMKEFGASLKPVCEQTISTIESAAACLTAGNALLEGREFVQAADAFSRAASAYDTEAMVSVARFLQAQALESAKEFEKALAVYKQLEGAYGAVKKSEMSTYHQARMLYYLGKFDEAEEKFVKISRESEGKEFAAPSRNYISLLNAQRSAAAKK
jgi:tetratricopeptide (TPR) repeat protein